MKKDPLKDFEMIINHQDYVVNINDFQIMVRGGVFTPDPKVSYSSKMLIDNLPDVRGKSVLDLGSGTGVVAIMCAKNGAAKTVATDNDEKALQNLRENLSSNHLDQKIEIRKSDLFENVDEKFDYILANLPINDDFWETDGTTVNLIKQVIDEANGYLETDGELLFVWASFAEVEPIREYLKKKRLEFEEVAEEKMGYTWYLFRIKF